MMKKQIVVARGLSGVLRTLALRLRSPSRPVFIFRVFDDASNAALYEAAADRVSRDRLCSVVWFIANGHEWPFDATLVPYPHAGVGGPKPYREVRTAHGTTLAHILDIAENMKACIDEAQS